MKASLFVSSALLLSSLVSSPQALAVGGSDTGNLSTMSGYFEETGRTLKAETDAELDDEGNAQASNAAPNLISIETSVSFEDNNPTLNYVIHRLGCPDETSNDVLPFRRTVLWGITDIGGLPYLELRDKDRSEHNVGYHKETFARRWINTKYTLSEDANSLRLDRTFKYRAFRNFDYVAFKSAPFGHFVSAHFKRKDGLETRKRVIGWDHEYVNFKRITEEEFKAKAATRGNVACPKTYWTE